MNSNIVDAVNIVVQYSTDYLMPLLLVTFLVAVIVRLLISFVVSRQKQFVGQFCKRVHEEIIDNPSSTGSFFVIVKKFLSKTYFEHFELRAKYKRRNKDHIMSLSDRIFLIQDGVLILIDDFLKNVRYLDKEDRQIPNFHTISTNVFSSNPVFNRLLGVFSIGRCNDLLNILPNIFIVAGIFGTFLGIMKALPELTGIDLTNAEASKAVIDEFLIKISFALTTSILGIFLSITMTFLNTILSPETKYVEVIDSFKSATDILWNKSRNNEECEEDKIHDASEAEVAFEVAITNMYARRFPDR